MSDSICPVCGDDWSNHDFGVPHPYCPKSPLPGKSWILPKRKTMKPEDQVSAIAEICGFKRHGDSGLWASIGGVPCGYLDGKIRIIPEYLSDLNEMHAAEKLIPGGKMIDYYENLVEVVRDGWPKSDPLMPIRVMRATAAQKAQAFLMTFDRWIVC